MWIRKRRSEMTNRKWALTNMLLPEDKKRRFADWRDMIILVVLSLLIGFLSIGKIYIDGSAHDLDVYNNGFSILNLFVTYNTEPDWFIWVPVFLVFGGLLFLFFYFRSKQTGILPKKWFTALVMILIVARIVGNFVFPYGEQGYSFTSPLDGQTVLVSYSGLSFSSRFVQVISEILYILFFYLCFTYVGSFSKSVYPIFHLGVHMSIIICIVLIVVSLCTEREILSQNLLYYLGKAEANEGALSLTTHRNVYGFFLLCGTLGCLFYAFRYHNTPFLVFSVICTVVCFLILSKTPALLCAVALLASFVLYPIFNFKKHKINSIFMLGVLAIIVVAGVVLVFKADLLDKVKKMLTGEETSTFMARIWHFRIAASMFNGVFPVYLIFGYGRIPFSAIYMPYQQSIGFEVLWTSHNSYLETIMFSGIVGLIAVVFGFVYLGQKIFVMFFKRKDRNSIVFAIMGVILAVYSIFEPRMLFLAEGTEQFVVFFLFFYPLLVDSFHNETDKVIF